MLEIGCASGGQLRDLKKLRPNIRACGVDPSALAIQEGIDLDEALDLRVGTSDNLAYANGQFDVVILGSCMYLVDRSDVYKTVSEVDRVLRPGGFLVVIDFDVPRPMGRRYHHHDGVFAYKCDHSAFFLCGGHYSLAHKVHHSQGPEGFAPDVNERGSISVLYKELYDSVYPIVE